MRIWRKFSRGGGGHSGTEGGRTRVKYFAEEGVFLRPRHVRDFVKEGYFFVPGYEVWGGGGGGWKSPYNPRNIRGFDAEWLPKWLGFRVCCHHLLTLNRKRIIKPKTKYVTRSSNISVLIKRRGVYYLEKVSVFTKIRVLFWPEISALRVYFNFDIERMCPPKYQSAPPPGKFSMVLNALIPLIFWFVANPWRRLKDNRQHVTLSKQRLCTGVNPYTATGG